MMIITDSAADIMPAEAKQLNIELAPLSIMFGEEARKMETEADFNQFFDLLAVSKVFPTTSQPAPEVFLRLYEKAAGNQEEVLVITISSGLSGTINSAMVAKALSGYDKIRIVDSEQAILTQRYLVERACLWRDAGKTVDEIVPLLESLRRQLTICGALDTLKYLGKGGRMPKTLAAMGDLLSIKPVIELRDTKLVTLGKARGRQGAWNYLWREFASDKVDLSQPVYFGYTKNRELGQEFMERSAAKFDLKECRLFPVGGAIGSHVGADCVAISYCRFRYSAGELPT